jgi:hypothetical protein
MNSAKLRRPAPAALVTAAALVAAAAIPAYAGAAATQADDRDDRVRHVLLISVDGMHQADLDG